MSWTTTSRVWRGVQAVEAGLGVAVLDTLHDAGHANLDKLVQIAGGNGQELDPLEDGIVLILGFFEDTAIESSATIHRGR